jgi:redox-sensitive bicupin YhaK (pirin superfamily)
MMLYASAPLLYLYIALLHASLTHMQGGTMEGFQIWVNLPAKDKMIPPYYQDVSSERIPEFRGDGFVVRVIAGEAFGTRAVVNTRVPIQYLDFHLRQVQSRSSSSLSISFLSLSLPCL